jgi:hypothetical protein
MTALPKPATDKKEYGFDDVWAAVKALALGHCKEDRFNRQIKKLELRGALHLYLEAAQLSLGDLGEVEDVAGMFFGPYRFQFGGKTKGTAPRSSLRRAIRTSGSYWRAVAYAEALPLVLRARQETLGTREPLRAEQAVTWLLNEGASTGQHVWVDVTFRFQLPRRSSSLQALVEYSSMPGLDLLRTLEAEAVPTMLAPGAAHPVSRPFERRLTLKVEGSSGPVALDLSGCKSQRLGTLLLWADRLASRCVARATSPNSADYPEAVNAALWLILTGVWPHTAGDATLDPIRSHVTWVQTAARRRQAPSMHIRIEAMDTPPKEVADAYRQLREAAGLSRHGRCISFESELLQMAACDVEELDGLTRRTSGFFAALERRYRAKALALEVTPFAGLASARARRNWMYKTLR